VNLREPQWHDIDCVGENTGTKYFGKFSIKPFLTHSERSEAFRLASKLSLGITDPGHLYFLNTMAYLKYHIVDTDAQWWKSSEGLELMDELPIYTLSDKVIEIQAALNPELKKKLDKVKGLGDTSGAE
jgi:hypothetical protein